MPPDGYSTGLAEPEARSVQQICDQGRVTFAWFDPPFRPEPPHCNQAHGIRSPGPDDRPGRLRRRWSAVTGACSAAGSSRVKRWRTAWSGRRWRKAAPALSRAATSAASALTILSTRWAWRYYQARFWARVELLPWDRQHEVDERRLVRPEGFLRILS